MNIEGLKSAEKIIDAIEYCNGDGACCCCLLEKYCPLDFAKDSLDILVEYCNEQRKHAEIGRATEKALFLHGTHICGLEKTVMSVEELLQWAKKEEEVTK